MRAVLLGEKPLRTDDRALWRILEVTRQISACTDLLEVLHAIIDAARELLDADRGTVFLYDSTEHELYTLVATGMEGVRFDANLGIAGECAKNREIINVTDCYADRRFNPDIDRRTGYRTRCLLTIPLIGYDETLVGVMQVLNKDDGVFDAHDEQVGQGLAAQAAVAIQRARLIESALVKQKLERDLAIAREIQLGLLPENLPQPHGYQLSGWSAPADQTGGDVYDVAELGDGRLLMLLGDATGHGIGPALSVSQMRAMMRIGVRMRSDLTQLVEQINAQLTEDLSSDRFITAFFGILDVDQHRVIYHSAGQGPILHYQAATDDLVWLDATAPPLGILEGLTFQEQITVDLAPGDVLGLISDGVFEQMDARGRQFDTAGVKEAMNGAASRSATGYIEAIREAVRRHAGAKVQKDDATILLLKRNE